jgi:hypothetical protein
MKLYGSKVQIQTASYSDLHSQHRNAQRKWIIKHNLHPALLLKTIVS